ncbi:MAG: hypothetical protein K8S54_04720 [Spirochaetia bacterium]|nr:hypothetical protein [Spirochaetia bacterium]
MEQDLKIKQGSKIEKRRPNYYANVHKALRYALSTLLIQAGRTCSDQEMSAEVFFFLNFHAENENLDLLPALANVEPHIVTKDNDEHHKLEELAESIKDRLENFPLNEEENWNWYLDLSRYVAFQLEHMGREERETLTALHKHFSDEEIAGFGARSVTRATQEERTLMLGWMFRALNPEESEEYLEKLKSVVPQEAFAEILKLKQNRTD